MLTMPINIFQVNGGGSEFLFIDTYEQLSRYSDLYLQRNSLPSLLHITVRKRREVFYEIQSFIILNYRVNGC